MIGHRVLRLAPGERTDPAAVKGALQADPVIEFGPNLIYIEGGLFADSQGTWQIPWPAVESLVERGAVLIAADCGTREICRHRLPYERAARFLRARAEIPPDAIDPGRQFSEPRERDQEIICDAERMIVSEWLRPAILGISQIAVRNPAKLANWEAVAASRSMEGPDVGRSGTGLADSDKEPQIFASVAQCAFGFVVLIAGEVSADDWIGRFPSNALWLTNLADLLIGEAERNRARAVSPIVSPFGIFLSHRSVNHQLAVRVGEALRGFGARVQFHATDPVPSDSLLHEASRGFEKMTHVVLFWSRACLGASWVERELATAVASAVERRLPVLVVRLDMTPVPKAISDSFRIEGLGMSPQEIAAEIMQGVRRLRRNTG